MSVLNARYLCFLYSHECSKLFLGHVFFFSSLLYRFSYMVGMDFLFYRCLKSVAAWSSDGSEVLIFKFLNGGIF